MAFFLFVRFRPMPLLFGVTWAISGLNFHLTCATGGLCSWKDRMPSHRWRLFCTNCHAYVLVPIISVPQCVVRLTLVFHEAQNFDIPFFFKCRQIAEYEIEISWVCWIFMAICRVEMAVFRRICCPIATDTFCVTLVGLPFPRLCATVPCFLSFLRFHWTVRRGICVFWWISFASHVPLSQWCNMVWRWASSFVLTIVSGCLIKVVNGFYIFKDPKRVLHNW